MMTLEDVKSKSESAELYIKVTIIPESVEAAPLLTSLQTR